MSESLNDQPEWHDVPQVAESLLIKYLQGDKSEKKHKQRLLKILKFYDNQEQIIKSDYEAQLRGVEEEIINSQKEIVALQGKQDQLVKDAIATQVQIREERIAELKRDHKQELKKVEDRSRDVASKQEGVHAANTRDLEAKHTAKLKALEDKHEDIVTDLQDDIAVLVKSADELKKTHLQQYRTMKQQLEGQLQDQAEELKNQIERLQKDYVADKELAKDRELQMQQERKAELDEMEREYEEEIRAIQRDFAIEKKTMQDDFSQSAREYEDEIRVVKAEAVAERQRIDEQYSNRIQHHEDEKEELEIKFAAEIQSMDQDLARFKHDHEEEKRSMEAAFAMERKKLKDNYAKVLHDHEEEKGSMRKAFDMQKKAMNEDFDARSAGMRSELARSSASLMQRDDDKYKAQFFNFSAKPLEDSALRSKFLELTKLVDDVGRSDWTPNRQLWSHRTLERLCKAQNLALAVLQRYIIQDCIWYLLYQYIFCSPFRVFGTEGVVIEDQWVKYDKQENTQDGSNEKMDSFFAWPNPQFETERWRYINVSECRTVLRLKLSELDPRGKLKKSYVTQTTKLSKELESSLSGMIELDKTIRERLDNLRMSAIRLWLEFGMQRCRLRITMHETEMIAVNEKAFQAEHRSIELVVSPTLSRHGNANGSDLKDWLVLKGCDGELIKLP